MSDADDLDESLRARLRAVAQREPSSAPDREREARLSAALVRATQSPRSSSPRAVALGLSCAAAAAAAWLSWPRPVRETPHAPALSAACALPASLAIARAEGGRQELTLPGFGELAASPGSALRVEASEPCRLALFLERGELAGDLHNLKPAQLAIRTPHGTVVVRGTRFSVRADGELEVVLLSGRVEIQDEAPQLLEPHHVFRKAGRARSVSASQPAQVARIADLLRPPLGAAPAPEPSTTSLENAHERATHGSASELLAQAESERRRGQLSRARALYKQASARVHEDDAEVALLRWLRLELESRAFAAAGQLLKAHARDFGRAKLQAEAAWLGVSLLREQGKAEAARAAARDLMRRFPGTPQADAASGYLGAP
jgi:hypothetical protein